MTIKKLTKIVILLIFFVFVIFKYFFYIDIMRGCYLRITPSILEFSNLTIKRAVKILKYASPEDYKNLCNNVRKINPNPSCGGFGGGCFHEVRPDTIDISTSKRELIWTVGLIGHETCHVVQNKENRPFSEGECNKVGDKILKNIVEF